MARVQVDPIEDAVLMDLLKRHPDVELTGAAPTRGKLQFAVDGWQRRLGVGNPALEVHGLVEIIDNNPLVCADSASVPGPAETLLWIAAAPLARAGWLTDSPVFACTEPCDEDSLDREMSFMGFEGGVASHHEPVENGPLGYATLMAAIPGEIHGLQVRELFEECYGRAFFVRMTQDWQPEAVIGQPHALVRWSLTPDEPQSLLKVQVVADRSGKLGAAQLIHCFNVMCGFEESLPFA